MSTPKESPLLITSNQVDVRATLRGTVQHLVLDGDRVMSIADDEAYEFNATCSADAGELSDSVPSALAVSIEMAPETGIQVYSQVRERLALRSVCLGLSCVSVDKMLSLDPEMLLVLKKGEARIKRWSKDALRSPDLAVARGKQVIAKELDAWFPTEKALFELLARAYELMDLTDIDLSERAIQAFVGFDSTASFFWDKIQAADHHSPGSPLLLLFEPETFGEAKIRCLSAIDRARTCPDRAEGKAHAALQTVQRVVEELYTPYLVNLDKLRALLTGDKTQGNHKLGHLVKILSPHFGENGSVNELTVHVRNAAAHSHFRYLEHQRLRLWNAKKDWDAQMTTSQLINLAEDVWHVVTAFEKATQVYAFRFNLELLRPVLPQMVRLLRRQLPEHEMIRIGDEYLRQKKRLLSELPKANRLLDGLPGTSKREYSSSPDRPA